MIFRNNIQSILIQQTSPSHLQPSSFFKNLNHHGKSTKATTTTTTATTTATKKEKEQHHLALLLGLLPRQWGSVRRPRQPIIPPSRLMIASPPQAASVSFSSASASAGASSRRR